MSLQKQVWLAFGACVGCCFGFPMDNDGVSDGEESLSCVQKYRRSVICTTPVTLAGQETLF